LTSVKRDRGQAWLHRAFKGELDSHYHKADKVLRASWSR
jgi:hypothetical protein